MWWDDCGFDISGIIGEVVDCGGKRKVEGI
jgi:hypothetical protein